MIGRSYPLVGCRPLVLHAHELPQPPTSCQRLCEEGALQAIYAEGKEHAVALGVTTMSTADMYVPPLV